MERKNPHEDIRKRTRPPLPPSEEELVKRVREVGIPTKDAIAALKKLGVTLSGKDEELDDIKVEHVTKDARLATVSKNVAVKVKMQLEVAQVGFIELVTLEIDGQVVATRGKVGDHDCGWEIDADYANYLDLKRNELRDEIDKAPDPSQAGSGSGE